MKSRTRIWLLFLAPQKYAQGWIAELGAWCSDSCLGKSLGSPGRSRCPLINLSLNCCQGLSPMKTKQDSGLQVGHWWSYQPQKHLSVHVFLQKKIQGLTSVYFW